MAVHPHAAAWAPEVAIGLLLAEKEFDSLAHRLGVLSIGTRVYPAARGRPGADRPVSRRVGVPAIEAFPEADLAGRAVSA